MTHTPSKLLVCIDGSGYADNVCMLAAWAAKRMQAQIDLLHVLRRHSDYQAPADDHTGSIGLGARAQLLDALTEVDEQRAKLDRQKGDMILKHGEDLLKQTGIETINTLHRRGALADTILELESGADIIFMGKRGEHADTESDFLGSNLEKVARTVKKPLCVVSSVPPKPIERFLIAYDGKASAKKAVDYIASTPLLKDLECHILIIENNKGDTDVGDSHTRLTEAGFAVTLTRKQSQHVDEEIANFVVENDIGLLITGAYSHSRIRSLFLGSTTASLIKSCHIPLLLFR